VRLLPFLILLASPLLAQRTDSTPARISCRVSRVIDGDTFTCTGGRRVRLLLVDAPEGAQHPAGDSATAALQRLVHRDVEVSLELGRVPTDRYGRSLAFVWLEDGRMANEELVRAGWALVYLYDRKNLRYAPRIQAAEDAARAGRRGWWRDGAIACRPKQYRDRECGRISR
jgi:micrococcal nuclease